MWADPRRGYLPREVKVSSSLVGDVELLDRV